MIVAASDNQRPTITNDTYNIPSETRKGLPATTNSDNHRHQAWSQDSS